MNIVLFAMLGIFIFMMFRRNKKTQQQQTQLQSKFAPGVEVMTSFGGHDGHTAIGLTVATLGEAEVFAAAGFDNIFLAYPIWPAGTKGPRIRRLAETTRLRVGVDNVDVEAATKRGIIVANAPQSNVITAAEHTMALLLGNFVIGTGVMTVAGTLNEISSDLHVYNLPSHIPDNYPVATGGAFAFKYRGEDRVCLCYFGDEGDRLQLMLNFPINQRLWYALATAATTAAPYAGSVDASRSASDQCSWSSASRSVAMRSASIHSTSGKYCAGIDCQNTVVSSLV